jgi:hypothetical protein
MAASWHQLGILLPPIIPSVVEYFGYCVIHQPGMCKKFAAYIIVSATLPPPKRHAV